MAYKKASTEGEMGSGDSDDEFFNVKLPSTPVIPEVRKAEVKKVYSPSRTKVSYDYKFDSSSDEDSDSPKPKNKSPQREPDANVFTPVPKGLDKISESTSKVLEKINEELKGGGKMAEKIDKPTVVPMVSSGIVGPGNRPVMPMGPMMGMPMMNIQGNMMMGGPPNVMMGMPGNVMIQQGNVMMGMMGPQPNMVNMINPSIMALQGAGNMMGIAQMNPMNMMTNQVMNNPMMNNPNPANRMFNPTNPNLIANQNRLRTPNPAGIRGPPVNFRPRGSNFKWQNNKVPPPRPGINIRLSNSGFDQKYNEDERQDSDAESSGRSSPSSDSGTKATSPLETPNSFKNDGSFMEMFKKMSEEGQGQEEKSKAGESSEGPSSSSSSSSAIKKPSTLVPSIVGKRRGGRVLKTGMVKKVKKVEEGDGDKGPKDAWSMYMAEVKKYREASCEEEGKTRPLVK